MMPTPTCRAIHIQRENASSANNSPHTISCENEIAKPAYASRWMKYHVSYDIWRRMLRSDVIVTAPMMSAPTNANAMYDSRPVRSTIAEPKPMSRPQANTDGDDVKTDEDGHRLAEDAVPDEDPVEAVAMLDRQRPADQRQPGEPGERRGDAR